MSKPTTSMPRPSIRRPRQIPASPPRSNEARYIFRGVLAPSRTGYSAVPPPPPPPPLPRATARQADPTPPRGPPPRSLSDGRTSSAGCPARRDCRQSLHAVNVASAEHTPACIAGSAHGPRKARYQLVRRAHVRARPASARPDAGVRAILSRQSDVDHRIVAVIGSQSTSQPFSVEQNVGRNRIVLLKKITVGGQLPGDMPR